MDHIISDIESRLGDKVPSLKYIAQDWGQLSVYDRESPPVKFPCALVDIQGGQFTNTGNLVQEGLLQIVLTVADWSQLVSAQAPQKMKETEQRVFKILGECYKVLQGWAGSADYTGLIRVNTSRIIRQDGLRLRNVTFTTNWQDDSAARTYSRATPPSVRFNSSFLK